MASKSAEWLQMELDSGSLLLLDCRPHRLYQSARIETAISLAIPGILLRRFRRGNLPIRAVIPNREDRERFLRRCRTDTVLLYDESSVELQHSGSVLALVLQKLWDDGCKAFFLKGGFIKFQMEYPEHCESFLHSSTADSSLSLSVLGLSGLRLSPDGSDGESDREPCSSTEFEDSPLPENQPAFPVQILPYLYLGCAKVSANLDVLDQHNIRYILNVTPNLPNVFECDGHFRYKQIPIADHWSQNLCQFFPEAISFIDEARSKQCGVLVHCLAGISRSVTVTVAYLMQKLHLPLNEAYDFVKQKKSNISPNFNFMGQLLDFERTLRIRSSYEGQLSSGQLYFSAPTSAVFQLDGLHN